MIRVLNSTYEQYPIREKKKERRESRKEPWGQRSLILNNFINILFISFENIE